MPEEQKTHLPHQFKLPTVVLNQWSNLVVIFLITFSSSCSWLLSSTGDGSRTEWNQTGSSAARYDILGIDITAE